MLINSIFAAAFFCICDYLIEEALVAALTEVLYDSREEPESVISTIGRMSGLLSVNAVLIVLIRTGLMTCIVIELNKRKSSAVAYLRRILSAAISGSRCMMP